MKIVKTVAAFAALAMASSAFAEVNLEASNKLKSDVVVLDHSDAADETTKSFPGVKNVINVEVTSDHVDAMVEGAVKFFADTNKDGVFQNDFGLAWDGGEISDWYVEARILDDMLTFGFHDNIHPEGDYLPVYDDNISAGNIGSEGFTLVYRPIEGLRLAASLPFGYEDNDDINWLKVDGKKEESVGDAKKKTNIRLGTIYDAGIAEFGVAAQDILDSDERTIGAYVYSEGLFGAAEGINFRAGFANSKAGVFLEDVGVAGENLWNVAFEFVDLLPVGLTVEAAGNLDSDGEVKNSDGKVIPYDIYAGVKVDVGINEQLDLAVIGKTMLDLGDTELDTGIEAKVALDIKVTDNDKVEVAVDYQKLGDDWTAKFPCYWKHTF